jgi:hypothetical protein
LNLQLPAVTVVGDAAVVVAAAAAAAVSGDCS